MMTPKEIEELLDKVLGDASDPQEIFYAWQMAFNLCQMYANKDAEIYNDDPMSYQAPSECFTIHMKGWEDLENRIQNEFGYAEEQCKKFFEEIYQPQPTNVEDLPF